MNRVSWFINWRKALQQLLLLSMSLIAAAESVASDQEWRDFQERTAYDPRKTLVDVENALYESQKSGNKAAELKALWQLIYSRGVFEKFGESRSLLERAFTLAQELNDTEIFCRLKSFCPGLFSLKGQLRKSCLVFNEVIAFAQSTVDACLARAYLDQDVLIDVTQS
jgi:hypothetical protein